MPLSNVYRILWGTVDQNIPHRIEVFAEMVAFERRVPHFLEEEEMCIPMKRLVLRVVCHLIVAENNAVGRFGVQQRVVEYLEQIVFDHNTRMKQTLLPVQIGYFRIDRDDGVRKLIAAGQRIDKRIVPNRYLLACARLVPSVAIAAEQNRRAVRMVEQVVFADDATRRLTQIGRASCRERV